MKILFVDHVFHKKTKSSNFFLDLVRANFEQVDIEFVDTDSPSAISALQERRVHDLVILWQLDYLAPLFLAAGYRTVVVPMYDGSANMPYEHWIGMRGASFVNFSRTLHERVIASGCRSLPVKYYLPPVKKEQLPHFEDLRGILWMRRPQDGLTPHFIENMLGGQLRSLHVHNAPDDGEPRVLSSPGLGVGAFPLSESRWSRDTNAYLDALKACNVFFAPRMSEGIGMAMLEAFSRGLLVVANDDAVHNEYVSNWVNGVLFNRDIVGSVTIPLDMARDMAYVGWRGAVSGYQEWLETRRRIIEFIKETPEPDSTAGSISPAFVMALWDAYLLGGDAYRHFLREHVVDWGDHDALRTLASPLKALVGGEGASMPLLDEDGLFFGTTSRSVGRKSGLSAFDAFSAHLANETVSFSFKLRSLAEIDSMARLVLDSALLEDCGDGWNVLVHINQSIHARVKLPSLAGSFQIEIPLGGVQKNELLVMLSFVRLESSESAFTLPKIKFISVKLEELAV